LAAATLVSGLPTSKASTIVAKSTPPEISNR
jgi:hypothetical protein